MFSGERLAELRTGRGWSQEVLAAKVGVKTKTISAYETNVISPSDAVKIQFAQLFDVSLDYLMGLTDGAPPHPHKGYVALPPNCPDQLKNELIHHLTLLRKAYNI